jgi:DNA-binding IclR family transcriptional regulator
MKTENQFNPLIGTAEQTSLAQIVEKWEEICRNCNPLTPIACVTSCKIWMQKNEFRRLCEKIENPAYLRELLNTLKNKRRLQILDVLSKGRYSVVKLQQELKRLGYYHSQGTIANEYLTPLMDVGLVEENLENQYYPTLFGCRLSELTKNSYDLVEVLPPHSECYEENALTVLMHEPKTFKDFECMVPAKSVGRVLDRLQKVELISSPKENDYVFFFRSRRNPSNERFSSTERRVYENIVEEGIPARKLAEKTGISLRRTYKYLRRLKGKKLVFARKRQKCYSLTVKGYRVAEFLNGLCSLTAEIQDSASHFLKDENHESPTLGAHRMRSEKPERITPLVTTFTKQE